MSILMWKYFKEAIIRGVSVSLVGICALSLLACGSKAKKQDDVPNQAVQQEYSQKTEDRQSDPAKDSIAASEGKTETSENSSEIAESSAKDSKSNTAEAGKKENITKRNSSQGKNAVTGREETKEVGPEDNPTQKDGAEDNPTQEIVIGKTENASEKAKQIAAGAAQ